MRVKLMPLTDLWNVLMDIEAETCLVDFLQRY